MNESILAAFILMITAVPLLAADTHCTPQEKVVFSCTTGKKIASVCASNELTPSTGYMQYRFGKKGAPELIFPKTTVHPSKYTVAGHSLYANGGTDSFIRFKSGNYTYVVFNSELRDGSGWITSDGVVVEKNGKEISTLKCKGIVVSEISSEFVTKAGIPEGQRYPE